MTDAPRWKTLLVTAITAANDASGKGGLTKVSRALGQANHSLVSRVLSGSTDPSPAFIARVLELYGQGQGECPFLRRLIPVTDCHRHALRPMPTGSSYALEHWETCQECEHKPNQGEKNA